jgi:hypothetical protein
MQYLRSQNSTINEFEATAVNWFSNEDWSWPLVKWNDDDGQWTFAIFHFNDDEDIGGGSWLMHSAYYDAPHFGTLGESWRSSRIDWNVSQISHLETLLCIMYHALSLSQWGSEDLEKLHYCARADLSNEKE